MQRQVLKVTQINQFYVSTSCGLYLFKNRLPFGAKIDVSNFSTILKQNFYDQGLIGTFEQVKKIAQKFRLPYFDYNERNEEAVSKELQKRQDLNLITKNQNWKGSNKLS